MNPEDPIEIFQTCDLKRSMGPSNSTDVHFNTGISFLAKDAEIPLGVEIP